ncbi:MAG: Ig-like domain-containing protein [Isosphaeraceae bacterium]|nr:Ig-like domain-containing protein [Isosphaeraceae bacterium]
MASNTNRRKPTRTPQPEALETRALLTAGAGNNFAILQAKIEKADVATTVPFTVAPSHFTRPNGKITIGVDVAQQTNSTVKPFVFRVTDEAGKVVPIQRANYHPNIERVQIINGTVTTAATLTLRVPRNQLEATRNYKVEIAGQDSTTGGFLVGFYLPGDANGTGVVDDAAIKAVRSAMGAKAGGNRYNFAADANRDGIINAFDLNAARRNRGAKTTVAPVISANLEPATDTGLQDRITTASSVKFSGSTTPGATITYLNLNAAVGPITTTADSSGNYTLDAALTPGSNTFQVTTNDVFGQQITGTIAPVTLSESAPAA